MLRALGEELPADPQATCPVEEFAAGDNDLVLRTLDELRREMQSHLAELRGLRAERNRGIRHADAPPSPVAIATPPYALTGTMKWPPSPTSLHPILADYLTDAVTRNPRTPTPSVTSLVATSSASGSSPRSPASR